MRTIGLNSNYYLLLKNPRDLTQIEHLGKQMFPGKKGFLRNAYLDATSQPYGHLLIDCKSDTPDELRVRSNIVPIKKVIKSPLVLSMSVYTSKR